jgi:hypothetical protein
MILSILLHPILLIPTTLSILCYTIVIPSLNQDYTMGGEVPLTIPLYDKTMSPCPSLATLDCSLAPTNLPLS